MNGIGWWLLAHLDVDTIIAGFQLGVGASTVCVVDRYVGRRGWNVPLRVCAFAGVFLILAGAATVTQAETVWPRVDFVFRITALCAYCVGAIACWWIRPRALGVAAGMMVSVPLIVVVPFLLFGMLFVPALPDEPPLYEERIGPGVSCRLVEWGGFAPSGHNVILYSDVPLVPLVRVQIARQPENDADLVHWPPDSCAKLAAKVYGRP